MTIRFTTITKALCLLLVCSSTTLAQQASIEGIKSTEFQGVEEIEGVGYYTVYEEEKQRGKIRNYNLKFLNFDYSEKNTEQIELSKVATVMGSANNKTHLAIAFCDLKLKQLSVKSFDNDGVLAGELNLTESKFPSGQIYKAPGGFIIVNIISSGMMATKLKFDVIYTDNNLNVIWKKSLEDETTREVIDVLATEDAVSLVYTAGKGMSKENYDQHLMRLSIEGDVEFDEVFASNYYYFPNKILIDGDNTLIFGSFPVEGKSKPAGVFGIAFDASGNIISKQEIDYESNISPEIKDMMSEEDLNMKESPQFIVNDVIKTDNGYVVISETIRLTVSIGGSVNVSTGGGSGGSLQANTAFHMGDFIVLSMDADLKLDKIQVITKQKNRVVFQGTIFNVNQFHKVLRENNVSNYRFCVANEAEKPSVVYTIRKSFMSNIQVGFADLNDEERVIRSKPIESDLEKLKDVNGFGVLRNIENKLTVYIFKKGLLSFYDLIPE